MSVRHRGLFPLCFCWFAILCASPSRPGIAQETGDARVTAARTIVRATVDAARINAGSGARRLSRDDLTEYLVRAAATSARQLPEEQRRGAFLAGVAIAIDTAELMRDQPLTGPFVRAIESDTERKARLMVLGSPTMRNRHDLAQHFLVSAQLTELAGAPIAEAAGLAKELADAQGSSGFSFTDLCADLAGVTFARRIQQGELSLDSLATSFRIADHLPDLAGLRDGIPYAEFVREFGSTADPRFQAVVTDIRSRVATLAGRK